MNIQKVHAVIKAIDGEYQELKIPQLLQNLHTTLNNSLAQRTPPAAKTFEDARKNLSEALHQCPSNSFVPSKHYILKTIGGDLHSGTVLAQRIDELLGANSLTPGKAVEELQKIVSEVAAFYSSIRAVASGFKKLNIPVDSLATGEYEIGVLMPKQQDLSGLEKELRELNHHMTTFSEVLSGKGEPIAIRAVSSGSPVEVFLQSTPAIALTIAATIERIVALYKNALEIRIAKKKLEELSVPKATVAPIEQHEKSMVSAELEKLADEIYKDYKGKDSGRKNELRNALLKALKYLAEKIDKGVDFEVSVSPTPPSQPQDVQAAAGDTGQSSDDVEKLAIIAAKGAALRQIEQRTEGVLFIQHEPKTADEEKGK